MKIKQISPQNSKILKRLCSIALKPKILYYYGEMPENAIIEGCDGPKVVAIVGSRKMTNYGKEHAYKASYELARRGVIIASGLATGVDAMAHRGALDAGGITIGVLGTPIDRMYPRANIPLMEEILEKRGVIMSECPPFDEEVALENFGVSEEEMEGWRRRVESKNGARALFLHRNRLISGISDAVIIIEADERSGSLNTAAHAFDQGRLVFALPGDVNRQMSRGCNSLFGKGALAYTAPEDVLDELFIPKERKGAEKEVLVENEAEGLIVEAIKSGVQNGEEILNFVARQGGDGGESEAEPMTAAVFNQNITMLEIKGVVKRLGGNMWMLR